MAPVFADGGPFFVVVKNPFFVRWGPAVIGAAVPLAVACLPASCQTLLALDRSAVAAGQVWRLWSGHVVHYGWGHVAVNAAALAMLLAWLRCGRCLVLGAVVCPPVLSAAILWLEPALAQYRGASGVVVGLGALAWCQAWQTREAGRAMLLVLAAVLVVKLAWESWPGRAVPSGSLPEGVSLAWSAHLAGLVLGLVWWGVCSGWVRDRQR